MSRPAFLICTLLICALLSCVSDLAGQEMRLAQNHTIKLLWYNVENLFHPDDAPSEMDDEFIPGGPRGWGHDRYNKKLISLAKVVIAVGEGDPPALVGLCEVEEGRILEDLVSHPILRPYSYAYIHREGRGTRSLEVALLYRPEKVDLLQFASISSLPVHEEGIDKGDDEGDDEGDAPGGRDFLHILIRSPQGDSLDILLCHLVSRYRGAGASAGIRLMQVERMLQVRDSISALRPGVPALTGGDMNASPGDLSLDGLDGVVGSQSEIGPTASGKTAAGKTAAGPTAAGKTAASLPAAGPSPAGPPNSYKYHGQWSCIDHFYLSRSDTTKLKVSAVVPTLLFLHCRDEKYGGWKPWRTYEGFSYNGGISDHLPVLVWLNFE